MFFLIFRVNNFTMVSISKNSMVLLVFIYFVSNVITQDISDNTEYQSYQYGRAIKCKRDDGVSQRCMPVFENVAIRQRYLRK